MVNVDLNAVHAGRDVHVNVARPDSWRWPWVLVATAAVVALVAVVIIGTRRTEPTVSAPDGPVVSLETHFDWELGQNGLSSEEIAGLARNVLTIANESGEDLHNVEARFQLPDAIAERPRISRDFAGAEIVFRAVSGGAIYVAPVGEGTELRFRNPDGQLTTLPPKGLAVDEERPAEQEGYANVNTLSLPGAVTNTGIWNLRIERVPAGHRVQIEFVTTTKADAAIYQRLVNGCVPHDERFASATTCFLFLHYEYLQGGQSIRRESLRPISVSSKHEFLLSDPCAKDRGFKLELEVGSVPVADAEVAR